MPQAEYSCSGGRPFFLPPSEPRGNSPNSPTLTMPELRWLGKDKVVSHHLDVPFRVLEPQYTVGGDTSENRIIHGDNLEALKALLPYYEGRIKCIYIDPPYNTGNENWVYNDNVNDPKIKRWLGKVVGKISEDLTRHDKWLCMMYPRLVLLHKLLANNGAIFISIDDNEVANLKLVMDEIWGSTNFIGTLVWQKKYGPANDAKHFSETHEYCICYAKTKDPWRPNLIPRDENQLGAFKNPDNDFRGQWRASDLSAKTYSPSTDYAISGPNGDVFYPPKSRSWIVSKERFNELLGDNRITFGSNGKGRPMQKKFLSEVKDGITIQTWWDRSFAADNKIGKYELKEIFPDNPFDTPKPTKLLERVLQIATGPNDIILDSFAGSGTTAHAVLNLNKQDERSSVPGNRKFILIEMEDYAETITAERVRRVIAGYGGKEGAGGGFTYYELGPALFTEDGLLNEALPLSRIREYIWYSETQSPLAETVETQYLASQDASAHMRQQYLASANSATPDTPHFLGKRHETAYYFYFEPDQLTTLDYDFLGTVQTQAGQYVIYADNCLIAKEWLQQRRIIFKKIPRDISRF